MKVKAIKLSNKKIRIVSGILLDELEVDWSIDSLTELKNILFYTIENSQRNLPSLKKKKKYTQLYIHEGGHHLDLVDKGVGSLNLLKVEEHRDVNICE